MSAAAADGIRVFLVFRVALRDGLRLHLADAGHLQQPVRIFSDDLQRFVAEFFHDGSCRGWADAFYDATGQKRQNTVGRRGLRLLEGGKGELLAVAGMDLPFSRKRIASAFRGPRQVTDGIELFGVRLEHRYGIEILFVMKDQFGDAAFLDFLHRFSQSLKVGL